MGEKAVPLLVSGEDGRFHLDVSALEGILGDREDPLVVVSIAGAFRQGKSFLLDYFIRFLETGGLGPDEPLRGFSWRGGAERETTGLLVWPKPYPALLPSGDQALVLLVDTQGAFDSDSTIRQAATVFALSTLISSVQVYNLSQNIQEDDLQHLQLFAEYGKLAACGSSRVPPFQKLVFLVRDWPYPYEMPFGEYGGAALMERRLKTTPNQHPELQTLRKHITNSFSDLSCFLMPHPGKKVVCDPNFDGRPSDLDPEFKKSLSEFLHSTLAPSQLILKRVGGQKVKAKEIVYYLKSYLNIFSGDILPRPTTVVAATAEANNLAAATQAKDDYYNAMKSFCGGSKPYINVQKLETEHTFTKTKVVREFMEKPKIGGKEFSEPYQKQLESNIEELYKHFRNFNDSKNVYKALMTPMLLISFAISFYVLSGFFALIGFLFVANILNVSMGISLLASVVWAYVRFTGDMDAIGQIIDYVVLTLWENIIKPIYRASLEENILRSPVAQDTDNLAMKKKI